ncbi:MAG: CBS domain-containing protein [Polyangiaceae bacterium]|nr:CBS domain-containing protein [Polyangiaceae bacterium]
MEDVETTITQFIGTRPADCLPPSASVARAAEAMRDNGAACVLVVEGGRLVGIFTERDFLVRVAAVGRSMHDSRLADVMTRAPETLGPDDDIRFAMNKMAVGGFRHVPIVDEAGRPLGVILSRDVIEHLSKVFAAVAREDDEGDDAWTDMGGG